MEKKFLMPEICSRCDSVFDLKYDLAGNDETNGLSLGEPLCWKCRVISLFSEIIKDNRDFSKEEVEEIAGGVLKKIEKGLKQITKRKKMINGAGKIIDAEVIE